VPNANPWSCVWQDDKIVVFLGDPPVTRIGVYDILPGRHCPRCASLDVFEFEGRIYCNNCTALRGLDRISAVGVYYPVGVTQRNLLSEHINNLKRSIRYAEPLGQAMALVVEYKYNELRSSNIVVPVPQHQEKYAERPYNQAEELAKVVGSRLGLPVANALSKTLNLSETDKGRYERLEITKEMYAFTGDSTLLQGKKVLLVDDIVTVGATASACTKVLKDNGVSIVEVLVAGRTYRPSES
jgi:predicted amidophosphoribosyltransferase